MTQEPTPREGRVARHLRLAREVRREPRVVVPWLRTWVARLWQAKGGGLYGLGYVITFLYLETSSFAGNFSGGTSGFLISQMLQYALRFSLESIFNVVSALIWPVHLLQWLGAWGLAVLVIAFAAFERLLRPLIEAWFPELAATRDDIARAKQAKQAAREAKRVARRAKREGEL